MLLYLTLLTKSIMEINQTRSQRTRAASRQRREQEKEELREGILAAAAALFLEHGYEAFSLRQVAEQIGYSPTTIYLYFEDKDSLLFAVVDQAFDRFTCNLQAAYDSTGDPQQRLRALAEAYIAFGRQNPAAYQTIYMQRPDFLLKWKAGAKQPRATSLLILKQAVQQAQEAGAITGGNVDTLSDVLWAAVHGAVSLAISMPQLFGDNLDASFAAVLDAALKGINPG